TILFLPSIFTLPFFLQGCEETRHLGFLVGLAVPCRIGKTPCRSLPLCHGNLLQLRPQNRAGGPTAPRSAASGACSTFNHTKPMRADWRLHRGVSQPWSTWPPLGTSLHAPGGRESARSARSSTIVSRTKGARTASGSSQGPRAIEFQESRIASASSTGQPRTIA